jgi:hypothetical protein
MFPKTKREFVNLSSAELQGHRSGKLEFREAWREPDISFNTAGTTMAYRISYEDGSAITTGAEGYGGVTRSEYFRSEFEALKRARRLLDDGGHHAVAVQDGSGRVLAGILLQLKLETMIVD